MLRPDQSVPMAGQCDARFAAVRDAFASNFAERGDLGGALCITLDGHPVVDLWGGWRDAARTMPWTADTIVSVASATKGLTTVCALRLMERGLLDLDAPVARYWPEFAQAGKEAVTVRQLLSHRAGLPALRNDVPADILYDWSAMTAALAAEPLWWEPGSQHGYHATTFGYLVGEVIRRINGAAGGAGGSTVGRMAAEEVTGPLFAGQPVGTAFHIGVPLAADALAAEVQPEPPLQPDEVNIFTLAERKPQSLLGRVFLNPARDPGSINTRAWRAAEIPASNGHCSARGLARFYAALSLGGTIDGVRILSRDSIEDAIVEQSFGKDAVLLGATRYGTGFQLRLPEPGIGIQMVVPNPRAFGHSGRGGSMGFADMEARLGFGYVVNQYVSGTANRPDVRWAVIAQALYEALG